MWVSGRSWSEWIVRRVRIDHVCDEMVEILDDSGAVVGIAPRTRVWADNLWHRTAYVVVRSSNGAVLAHQRALTKRLGPGVWDLGFGGACDVGESWPDTAARELFEEAGIRVPLRELGSYRWDGDGSREVGVLYETVSDGPFVHPPDEVAASRFVQTDELDGFLAGHRVLGAARALVVPHLRR